MSVRTVMRAASGASGAVSLACGSSSAPEASDSAALGVGTEPSEDALGTPDCTAAVGALAGCCACCSDTQASHNITMEKERIRRAIRRRWSIGLLSVLRRSGDGIIPARMEGMATTHSADRQPGTAPGTVKLDRLACVFGTTRVEAAGATE